MLDYKYAYLVGDLLLALIWSILFLIRKDLRKEILSLSILGGIAGIATEVFYLQDYFNSYSLGFRCGEQTQTQAGEFGRSFVGSLDDHGVIKKRF